MAEKNPILYNTTFGFVVLNVHCLQNHNILIVYNTFFGFGWLKVHKIQHFSPTFQGLMQPWDTAAVCVNGLLQSLYKTLLLSVVLFQKSLQPLYATLVYRCDMTFE